MSKYRSLFVKLVRMHLRRWCKGFDVIPACRLTELTSKSGIISEEKRDSGQARMTVEV
jgi:hypothetical protein